MVLPNFVRQALQNKPITVYGDGKQSRCFGYVLDAVEALVRIAKSDRVVGEIINIGNDQEITIGGLAELVRKRLQSQSEIVHVSYEDAYGPGFEDMFRRVPSLAKLERLVAYRPTTPLATIIDAVASELHSRVSEHSVGTLSDVLTATTPLRAIPQRVIPEQAVSLRA
jgi:UDP-glucose 4-epimerase